MSAVHGRHFGKEMCAALGLDPSTIAEMVIRITPSEAATVEVRRFIQAPEVTDMARFITDHYELCPVKEPTDGPR